MKTVWKYQLETADAIKVAMPVNAEILAIQMQYGRPCLWALVDDELPKEVRTFAIFGTGNPIPNFNDMTYIGTYQQFTGQLVFHCFEIH